MKEHAALFNDAMVRAILDGRKTQTRRPMKPQPVGVPPSGIVCDWLDGGVEPGEQRYGFFDDMQDYALPYAPGDVLWVREAWGLLDQHYRFIRTTLPKDCTLVYRSDHIDRKHGDGPGPTFWRPSIHMPRWASRLDLLVKAVRVERVQEISEADVLAEGWTETKEVFPNATGFRERRWFRKLWSSMYAKPQPRKKGGQIVRYESYPWSGENGDRRLEINNMPHDCYPNPWVPVTEFELLKRKDKP